MYKELTKFKESGDKIKLKDLTRNHLYRMYVIERVSKREIADLCDCSLSAVRGRLYREGINIFDRTTRDLANFLENL